MARGIFVLLNARARQRVRVDVHAAPGAEDVDHGEADDQREGRHDLEVDQRLDGDATDGPCLAHGRDAMHDRAEDDEPDHHGDEAHEELSQCVHDLGRARHEPAEDRANDHANENLQRGVLVERLARLPATGHFADNVDGHYSHESLPNFLASLQRCLSSAIAEQRDRAREHLVRVERARQ